jgi:hypothetical protein
MQVALKRRLGPLEEFFATTSVTPVYHTYAAREYIYEADVRVAGQRQSSTEASSFGGSDQFPSPALGTSASPTLPQEIRVKKPRGRWATPDRRGIAAAGLPLL